MLLSDIVRLNGRKTPSRTAIITGERTVTFGELRDSAWRVANAMLELAEPGDRVGILAENIPEYVECYYGVPAAGMALTFLNYRLHPKEWVWILNNAEARVLIVEQKYLEHIEPLLGDIATMQHVIVIDRDTGRVRPLSELRRRRRGGDGRRTTTRRRRGLDRVAALHEWDDGVPQGRDAHPPQPHRGHAGVGDRVRAAARRAQPGGVPAVPRRRIHRARHPHARRSDRADPDVRARAVDAARRRARHHRHRVGPDDAQHGAAAPEARTTTGSTRCAASATARPRCRSRCCAPRSSASARSCTRASG